MFPVQPTNNELRTASHAQQPAGKPRCLYQICFFTVSVLQDETSAISIPNDPPQTHFLDRPSIQQDAVSR
jgi:hypothetical protein